MKFDTLPLSDEVLRGIQDLGFTDATPIQSKVIPYVLQGRDVCALAQTGSGKTASYTVPVLDILSEQRQRSKLPRALILVPTRELAQQVSESFDSLGKYKKGFSYSVIIGGSSSAQQVKKIKAGVDVVIATPGRLLDLFERGNISFHDISMVVIDEADRMLDMGFIPDIEQIMALINKPDCQKLCLSATMAGPIQKLVDKLLVNPKQIVVEFELKPADSVEQIFVHNAGLDRDKRSALRELFRKEEINTAIVFCNRKIDVSSLSRSLKRYKFNAEALHGDMTQSRRTETLEHFKEGKIDYLIASDVAARGIDVEKLPFVINYDVPTHADEYVHRVGRTGRAGETGKAITFVDDVKSNLYERIVQYIPENARTINAEEDLRYDPFKELGYRKPSDITDFNFPYKSPVGFGVATPRFMTITS